MIPNIGGIKPPRSSKRLFIHNLFLKSLLKQASNKEKTISSIFRGGVKKAEKNKNAQINSITPVINPPIVPVIIILANSNPAKAK